MKYAITLFLAIVISAGMQVGVKAQQIDRERMQQDLHIAENILRELFKTNWNTNGTGIETVSFSLGVGQFKNITGIYVPDYGVIFKILGGSPAYIYKTDSKGNSASYEFENGGEKVTKKTIIDRSEKFLCNYGPTIGQLSNNDHITLIYLPKSQSNFSFVHFTNGFTNGTDNPKNKNNQKPSSILLSVKKSDLNAYKGGKLNKNEFNNHVKITNKYKQNMDHQDVKIMSKIIKTSFKKPVHQKFHISISDYAYINNMGALFDVVASYGTGFESIESEVSKMKNVFKNVFKEESNKEQLVVVNGDTMKGQIVHGTPLSGEKATADTLSGSSTSDNSQPKNNLQEVKAYHQFIEKIKQTIVNYGPTLRSVNSDEQVFISVTLTGSNDKIPDRVTLQLRKSILEALGTGKISRQQAMDKISVREY